MIYNVPIIKLNKKIKKSIIYGEVAEDNLSELFHSINDYYVEAREGYRRLVYISCSIISFIEVLCLFSSDNLKMNLSLSTFLIVIVIIILIILRYTLMEKLRLQYNRAVKKGYPAKKELVINYKF